jgi:predicted metalloprotease with PDZ domain
MQGRVAVLTLLLSLWVGGGTSFARCTDPQEDVVVAPSGEPRGWLGVSITDMTADQAKKVKGAATTGALVTDVQKDSPAEKAGLHEDDVIIRFGERTVEDVDDLQKAVGKSKPGSAVKVTLMRGEKKLTVTVTVGKAPKPQSLNLWYGSADPMHAFRHQFHISSGSSLYGLELWELNRQMGEYFGAPNGRGVLVISVEKESEGARAGFKAGDVILRVGRETIEDLRDISEGFEEFKEGDSVRVELLRKGERKSLTITAGAGQALLGLSGGIPPLPEFHGVPEFNLRAAPRIDREELNTILRLTREGLREKETEALKTLRKELEKIGREVQKSTGELKRSLWKEMRAANI